MSNIDPIDISNIISLLPTPKKESTAESGCFYGNESPEEIYNRIIYTSDPVQITYQKPPTPFVKEEIEAVTELNSREPQLKNANNRYRQQATFCPYEFKLSCDLPVVVKPLVSFDSQLQNITIPIDENGDEENSYPKIETIAIIGQPPLFNTKMIGIRSSLKRQLPIYQPSSKSSFAEPSQIDEDPFIIDYRTKTEPRQPLRVFSTARALAAICVCQRSVYPFDLIIEKVDNENIYVKVRKENEAATQETSLETIMTTDQISREKVTQEFIQNITETMNATEEFIQKVTEGMETVKLSEKEDDEKSIEKVQPALIYRSIQLKGIEFIVRGQIDSVQEVSQQQLQQYNQGKSKSKQKKLNLNGLHHSIVLCRAFVDAPSSLRKSNIWENIEQRRGAIFLGETNANSSKVARWVATAILTGAETCMVGYITRSSLSSSEPHLLLGVERHNIEKFANDISLKKSNMYAILSEVFNSMETAKPATYVFMKDSRIKKTYCICEASSQNNQ